MQQRLLGPKSLQHKVYHNLSNLEEDVPSVSLSLRTVEYDLIDLSTSCTVCVRLRLQPGLEADRGRYVAALQKVWLTGSIFLKLVGTRSDWSANEVFSLRSASLHRYTKPHHYRSCLPQI
jgi:hypothetical protein